MVRLMNSAMMPREGIYTMRRISKREFIDLLVDAYEQGELDSYLGYQANIDLIYSWTGIRLPFKREMTTVEDGDVLLIMKLKYRLQDPGKKGEWIPREEDYEYFICYYREE